MWRQSNICFAIDLRQIWTFTSAMIFCEISSFWITFSSPSRWYRIIETKILASKHVQFSVSIVSADGPAPSTHLQTKWCQSLGVIWYSDSHKWGVGCTSTSIFVSFGRKIISYGRKNYYFAKVWLRSAIFMIIKDGKILKWMKMI